LGDFPGWVGTGPELVAKLEEQATSAGAEFVYEEAVSVDLQSNPKRVDSDLGTTYATRALIAATGAHAIHLTLPSDARLRGRGVSECAACDGPLFRGKAVVVVGGGDVAVREALFLSEVASSVKLIHRRDQLRASEAMRRRLEASSVEPIWNSAVVEFLGDEVLEGIKIANVNTKAETVIECSGAFVAIGHAPSTKIFEGQLEIDKDGTIATRGCSPRTTVLGVFACGECADRVYRQAITSAATGCQAALLAERFLRGIPEEDIKPEKPGELPHREEDLKPKGNQEKGKEPKSRCCLLF
jgi:thioredoxin reductase (NADPH)